jgi:RIO-like serine/threonine protein kinase
MTVASHEFAKILKNLGYNRFSRLQIRPITHVAQYYRAGALFLKCSFPNRNIKTLKEEFDVMRALDLPFIPKLHFYKKVGVVEIIAMDFIPGDVISESTYFTGLEDVVLEQIRAVFEKGYIHGDIKLDSFIIRDRSVYMIDFNRAYRHSGKVSFEASPDICGNNNSPRWGPSNFKCLKDKITLIKEKLGERHH